MEGNLVICIGEMSFLSKKFFGLKVKNAIKECDTTKDALRKDGILKKDDERVNLVIPNHDGSEIDRKYVFFKGYNSDGTIKPLRKFKMAKGGAIEEQKLIPIKIKVVDLYEKSIYIYEYSIVEGYIIGNLIKEEKDSKLGKTVVFTKEKIKVQERNVNNYITYDFVDEFINKVIL